ncbi:MAG: hypothetical protein KDD70_00310 [Bdellovibrionales bacterium]|nr:hypothetical protein [Bdellovibrionales bacterium]
MSIRNNTTTRNWVGLALLAAVAACTFSSNVEKVENPDGSKKTTEKVDIKIDPIEVQGPLWGVKIGTGTHPETGRRFDVMDTDGDDTPDLLKDEKTGKFYKIVSITPSSGASSFVAPTLPQYDVVPYENNVSSPIKYFNTDMTATELHKRFGMDQVNAALPLPAGGQGNFTLQNAILYQINPMPNIVDSVVELSIVQSSIWQLEDVRNHPNVRYELLGLAPQDWETSPGVYLMHLEGSFMDVARYLADNGTTEFAFDDGLGLSLSFNVRDQNGVRMLDLFFNNALVASAPF